MSMDGDAEYRPIRPHTRFVLWVVLAALACGVAVIAWAASHADAEPWHPLYGYADQAVEDPVVVAAPGERVSVNVIATKCSTADVEVTGSWSWASVDPPGRVVPVGTSAGRVEKGCRTDRYNNLVPQEVLAATVDLGGTAVWRVVGTETPLGGGRVGVPATWRTTEITIRVVRPLRPRA